MLQTDECNLWKNILIIHIRIVGINFEWTLAR